jgi:hypothetical protein
MKVFIAFLLTCFVLGGLPSGRIPIRKPILFGMACVLVAASFFSLRVIE